MIDHDAAVRFDTALDQLVRGERIPDDGLIDSARTVQQLDAEQRGVPSADFRAQLRAQIAGDRSANHLNGHHPVAERPIPAPLPKRPAQPRPSHRWLAFAAALFLLLAGGGAIVLEGFGLRNDSEPSAIPAVSFASPDAEAHATGSPGATTTATGSPGATTTATALTPQVPMALGDGILYRIERDMGDAKFTGLRAYRTEDSKRLWEIASSDFGNLLVAAGNTVFTTLKPNGSDAGQIVAYDAGAGDVVWSMPSGGTVTGLTESDGIVYAVDSTGSVAAIDAAPGTLRWATKIDAGTGVAPIAAGPTIVTAPGYVAAVTPMGTLAVLDRTNGEVAWSKDGYQPEAVMLAATTNMLIVTNLETFSYVAPGTPVTAGGSPESSPSAGATPLADATDGQEITSSVWNVTQYHLSNGGFFVGGGSTELTAPPTAIGDVVAIPGKAAHYGGSAFGLNGQSSRVSGQVIVPLPAEVNGKRITQLGTWTPPDGAPEQFVAVAEDGILTLVSPKHLGLVDNANQDDPYDGAVVDLGQPVISQPVGDENDLWVTLADGTLASIHPDRLNQTLQHPATPATPEQDASTPQAATSLATIPMALAGDMIYRVVDSGGFTGLRAYQLGNLQRLWETPTRSIGNLLVADEQGPYLSLHGSDSVDSVLAFDARGGPATRWRWTANGLLTGLAVDNGLVFAVDSTGMMTALDATSGEKRWERKIDDGISGPPKFWSEQTVGVSSPFITVLTAAGTLAVLFEADGSLIWRLDGNDPAGTTFAAGAKSVVLFERVAGNGPWQVQTYNLANGSTWGSRGIAKLTGDPVAIGDVVAIPGTTFGTNNSGPVTGLLGLNSVGGAIVAPELSTYLAGETITRLGVWTPPDGSSPLFVAVTSEGLLFLVSPQRIVGGKAPVSASDGAMIELGKPVVSPIEGNENGLYMTLSDQSLLEVPAAQLGVASSATVVSGGATPATAGAWITNGPVDLPVDPYENGEIGHAVAVGQIVRAWGIDTGWTQLQAVDAVDGRVSWEQAVSIGGDGIVAADNLVLIAGSELEPRDNGYAVAALDVATGSEVWRAQLSDQPAAMIASGESVFVLGASNRLDALDLATGEVVYSVDVGGDSQLTYPQFVSFPNLQNDRLVVADGTVYASLADGSVAAVNAETGEGRWWSYRLVPGQVQVFVVDGVPMTVDYGDLDAIQAQLRAETDNARVGTPTTYTYPTSSSCVSGVPAATSSTPSEATPAASPVTESPRATENVAIAGLDPETGAVMWTTPRIDGSVGALVTDAGFTSMVVTGDGSIESIRWVICAYDPRTGQTQQIERTSELSDEILLWKQAGADRDTGYMAVLDNGSFVPAPFDDHPEATGVFAVPDKSLVGDSYAWIQIYEGAVYVSLLDGRLVKVPVTPE